jgi:GTP cyclohydrolase II
LSDGRAVAQGIDALRRGWPVAIDGRTFLAVETADAAALAALDEAGPTHLLISGNRAVTLKLANQLAGVPDGPVLIARAPRIDPAAALAVADPALDLAFPLKGPFQTIPIGDPAPAAAALRLARLAGLLPALFMTDGACSSLTIRADAVARFALAPEVRIAARAQLPSVHGAASEIVAFRAEQDTSEHVALLLGSPGERPPLVRVHSECLTGDVFGSLKCDCGPQLSGALQAIAEAGWGILIYLRQEGRGIGLVNKLRAYALQDQGFDTVDANLRLGFADDERDFAVAAHMLAVLKQTRIRLLSNNPEKARQLQAHGVEVTQTLPLRAGDNPHNRAYLATKRDRSGHQL